MKKDMIDLKKLVHDIMGAPAGGNHDAGTHMNPAFHTLNDTIITAPASNIEYKTDNIKRENTAFSRDLNEIDDFQDVEEYQEFESTQKPMSLEDMERQMIKATLEKHRGRRKAAADELKISERTLYRKIKEYGIE